MESASTTSSRRMILTASHSRQRAFTGIAGVALLAAANVAAQAPPAKEAPVLSPATFAAAGRHDAILTVGAFGYYAVTAGSQQGTSLQLVDRMAGPGPVEGVAGERDGRIDAFLDRGTYKIIATGHEKASGQAALTVHPYVERNAPQPPELVELKPVAATLDDFQQVSYWLRIEERRQVAIEIAGRNLSDVRLWEDGTWLVDVTPEREVIEPKNGQPLLDCRLATELEPGLYLLSTYGGPGQPWAEGSDAHPLYVRYGIPRLGEAGRRRFVVSPFGVDRYLVPGEATFYRLELPEARPAQLTVGDFNEAEPFSPEGSRGSIDKDSLPPAADVVVGKRDKGDRTVTVRADAGQPYVLTEFERSREYIFKRSGDYWVSTVHSGHAADSVDATAIVARWTDNGQDRKAFLDSVVELDSKHGWARRCNLLDELTVFLKVGKAGKYEVLSRGTEARFRIEPFFTERPRKYQAPPFKGSGVTYDLDEGFYVLTVEPETKGILDIVVRPLGLLDVALEMIGKQATIPETPLRAAARFPDVKLDSLESYVLYLNEQPGVSAGVVLRELPLDLTEPLPVAQRPGEDVEAPFRTEDESTVTAEAEDGSLLELAVDGGERAKTVKVEPGDHTVRVFNTGKETVIYSLAAQPVRLAASTPLPPLPEDALAELPEFTELTAGEPQFLDLANDEIETFRVSVGEAALYRLETTGLLATSGNLRSRTELSLAREDSNGIGRNFLIQQYLREGEYQLSVSAAGRSAGHLGVVLRKAPITDGGTLADGVPARVTLPADAGIAYRFSVPSKGEYHLATLGLGHTFRCRLEDADGWPLLPPGGDADITRVFDPGEYRLVLLPEPVVTRRLTLLARAAEPLHFEGHGPHQLPLAHEVEHVWLETGAGEERPPDVWEVTLPAAVTARVELSGEMQGTLERTDAGDKPVRVEIPPGRGWRGDLGAGHYRLAAVCSRRNNQVGYRVGVWPEQLVAGLSRDVKAPASVPVSVGRDGLVELSSFGGADVKAELVAPGGHALAANDDRPDDWNFHIATPLTPGRFTLRVSPVGSASATCTVTMRAPEEVAEKALAAPGSREVLTGEVIHVVPLGLPPGSRLLAVSVRSTESVGCSIESGEGADRTALVTRVGRDVRIELPLAAPDAPAPDRPLRLRLWSVDHRGLPATVTVAGAVPPTKRESALAAGVDLTAIPGTEPATAVVAVRLERPGVFRLEGGSGLRVSGAPGMPAVEVAGEPVAATSGWLWLVGDVEAGGHPPRARAARASAGADGIALRIGPEGPVACDLTAGKGGPVLVRVTSMAGQPAVRVVDRAAASDSVEPAWADRFVALVRGLFTGRPSALGAQRGTSPAGPAAMAVGGHAAVAVSLSAQQPSAAIWQATGGGEPLEVRLESIGFDPPKPESAAWGILDGTLNGRGARELDLPAGRKHVRLALGRDTVAVLADGTTPTSTHWGGGGAFVEELEAESQRLVLFHTGSGSDPFSIAIVPPAPGAEALVLSADHALETGEVAAGTLRVDVPPLSTSKDRPFTLHVRGGSGNATLLTADGRVLHGTDIVPGAGGGTLLVPHGTGRLLCWADRPGGLGEALWGLATSVVASPVELPASLKLSGASMQVKVSAGHPVILHLRTATPVATRLVRPEAEPEVDAHPNGCSLDAYLPSGEAELGMRAIGGAELIGTAELTATEITPTDEGLGPEVLLAPGATHAFSFVATVAGPVGVGVRADSDVASCTLFDGKGRRLGSGVILMADLQPGTYVLAIHAPASASAIRVRPGVAGIRPPDTGPPEEVIRHYLRLAKGEPDELPASARPQATQEQPGEEPEGDESGGDGDSGGGAR